MPWWGFAGSGIVAAIALFWFWRQARKVERLDGETEKRKEAEADATALASQAARNEAIDAETNEIVDEVRRKSHTVGELVQLLDRSRGKAGDKIH